jgi:hypothetical protein
MGISRTRAAFRRAMVPSRTERATPIRLFVASGLEWRHARLPPRPLVLARVCDGAFQRTCRQVPAFECGNLRLGEVFDFGRSEPGYVVGRDMYTPLRIEIEAVLEHDWKAERKH